MAESTRNQNQTIGTDSTIISEAKSYSYRKIFYVVNISTGGQIIYIAVDDEATIGHGIQLAPGGYYMESMDAGFIPTQSRISAISSIAGGIIAMHERVIN